MLKIEKYSNKFAEAWNTFIKKSKNGIFMFDRNYMDYHKDRFEDHSLMFFDDDELVAVLPASIKDHVLKSHGGLTYGGLIMGFDLKQEKNLEIFELLKAYLKDNGISSLIYKQIPHIYHKYPAEEDLYGLFRIGAKIFKTEPSTTIDLSCPIKFTKGRKAQIARAKKNNVIITESNDFDAFIDLENFVLGKYHNQTAVHTGKELSLLKSNFDDNIKLYVALKDGELIAGGVFFIYDNCVHSQYLAANDFARKIGGLDLVISTVIDKYKDTKKYLDFGISTEDNGQVLNTGLISQKTSFGGRTIAYNTFIIEP